MSDELNTSGLDKLIKMLKGNLPSLKIGIFGDSRNAEIGSYHEFGTSKMPKRSFLREPMIDGFEKALENSGAFDKDALKDVMAEKSIKPWLEKAAVVAEGVVAEAFANGGNGNWAPWVKGYENNTGQLLIDTQQLRNSITTKVSG